MTKLDAYVSMNSPWTFLGWQGLRKLISKHDLKVTVKPSKFAEVFAATGGLPLPKRAPERRAYRMMELKRWRDYHGIPIVLEPAHFPIDEAVATRLVIAAQKQGLDAGRLTEEIGHALWVRNENIADPTVIAAAAKRAGVDAAAVLKAAPPEAELDVAWAANTAEAVSRGVFGAPSYVLDTGEIFWGQDRVDLLGWRLGGGGKN
jgi:2-hydroxychromene-2-carboxylate isomerase